MPRSVIRVIALLALAVGVMLLVVACFGEKKNRSDYGSRWPFTVDSVTLHCENDAVWVETGGQKYALNGWASTYLDDDLPLERIWRRSTPAPRVNIGPMINEGLALC